MILLIVGVLTAVRTIRAQEVRGKCTYLEVEVSRTSDVVVPSCYLSVMFGNFWPNLSRGTVPNNFSLGTIDLHYRLILCGR